MSGLVILNDLQLDTIGMAHVKFTVYSVPAQYSHEVIHELTVYPTEAQSVTIDTTNTINVKFDLDFATYGNTQFGAVVLNYFQSRYHYMKMSNLQVSQGRLEVTTQKTKWKQYQVELDLFLQDIFQWFYNRIGLFYVAYG